jgi:hypothetical protein
MAPDTVLGGGRKVERESAGDRREYDAEPSEQSWPEQLIEHVAVHVPVIFRLQRIAPHTHLQPPEVFVVDLFLVHLLVHAEGEGGCWSLTRPVPLCSHVAVGLICLAVLTQIIYVLVGEAGKIVFQPSVHYGQPGHPDRSDECEQAAKDGHDQEDRAHVRQRSGERALSRAEIQIKLCSSGIAAVFDTLSMPA